MSAPTPSPLPPTPSPRRTVRWLAGLTVLLVGMGGAWLWWPRDRPPVPPEVDLAGAEPEVREAISRARDRVLTEPESDRTWGQYGMLLRAHAYEYPADACFARATALAPDVARWPYYRGLHALLRDPDRAVPFLQRAADLQSPTSTPSAPIHMRLAEAYLERGRLDEAEAVFRRILDGGSSDPRASYGLALIALSRGDTRAAAVYLGPALESPFTRKKATARRAALARLLGDTADAERTERTALALPDDLPWVDPFVTDYTDLQVGLQSKFLRIESLQAQGRRAEAVRQCVEIAETHPSTRTLVSAGISLAEIGDYPAADRYLRACLQLDPDHIQANYFLAVSLFFQADREWEAGRRNPSPYREIATHARRCLARKPDHGLAHQFLGRALLRLGEISEAVMALRQAVACRPEMTESHLYLAEALLEAGESMGAESSLAVAESLAAPNDPRTRQLRARMTASAGPKK